MAVKKVPQLRKERICALGKLLQGLEPQAGHARQNHQLCFCILCQLVRVCGCIVRLVLRQWQAYPKHHEEVEELKAMREVVLLTVDLALDLGLQVLTQPLVEDVVEDLLVLPGVEGCILQDEHLVDEGLMKPR